ncbi:MAG: PIN domain-containing protein [Methylacidiphilales bacterium]|nr:PIN domain-containing protein [Candidatus Methylacidiphilales bacterium]
MRTLLDINVVIALLDPDHAFHDRAHAWWAAHAKRGWASCPLTESGVVRIMSNRSYSRNAHFMPGDLISRLQKFAGQTNHEFWPDDLSIRDDAIFSAERIHSSRHLTDLYLLALAVKHGGKLATFDTGILVSAVRNAKAGNLSVI